MFLFPWRKVDIGLPENCMCSCKVIEMVCSFSSVQSLSCVWLFATPWIAARQASLSITNSRSLLKLMPIESVMPSSHLILCRPRLLLPPNPSQHQGLFQWVNSSHEVTKVCSLGYHNWELVHLDFFFNPKIFLLPCTFLCNKVKNVWNYLFRLLTWYLLPNV